VLERPGRVETRQIDAPRLEDPTQALVRVRTVGLCGTDVSIFHGSIPVSLPRVLGHEVAGEIVDGPDSLARGTRVLIDPNLTCGDCARCLEHRENICDGARLIGRDRDGGMQDLVVVPASNLYPLPGSVPEHVAPAIQMLSTCLHGQRLAGIDARMSVAIVGLGVTGSMHVQLARMRGARPIVGITRSPEKLAMSMRLGADLAIGAEEPDLVQRTHEATGGGADVVIESAGTVATLGLSVALARPGGRVLAYGTITEADGPFPYYDLYYKELVVISPRAATVRDVAGAIEIVAGGSVDLEPLVTDRIRPHLVGEALAAGPQPGRLKTVIEMDAF
jgi:L-iditol 2-dehydrogenase